MKVIQLLSLQVNLRCVCSRSTQICLTHVDAPCPPVHLVTAPAGTQSHHKALPTCWHTNELMFPYSRSVPLSLFLLNTFENINLSSEKKKISSLRRQCLQSERNSKWQLPKMSMLKAAASWDLLKGSSSLQRSLLVSLTTYLVLPHQCRTRTDSLLGSTCHDPAPPPTPQDLPPIPTSLRLMFVV